MSIIVSNLTKIYGSQKAVNNISFAVGANEIVGFLGPNGAGKSTTMKIVTGYLQPDFGKVMVKGSDISENPFEAKKHIGYLPEANPLYYEMYVREYLYFVGSLHQLKNIKQRTEEVINLTGLSLESNKKTGQLSKGYKQRVGLAAALIHDPAILILDEPTSGLDPNQIVEIRKLIKSLGKNKTVLFSSHILQEVESLCDRVIIINKGNLVADDSLQKLRTAGEGVQIVQVQFGKEVSPEILAKLPAVESISLEGAFYFLKTADPDRVKKHLLEFSVDNKADILSLQNKNNSLEDIFRNLTAEKKEIVK